MKNLIPLILFLGLSLMGHDKNASRSTQLKAFRMAQAGTVQWELPAPDISPQQDLTTLVAEFKILQEALEKLTYRFDNLALNATEQALQEQLHEYGRCIQETKKSLSLIDTQKNHKHQRLLASTPSQWRSVSEKLRDEIYKQKEMCENHYHQLNRVFSYSTDLSQHLSKSKPHPSSMAELIDHFIFESLYPGGVRVPAPLSKPTKPLPQSGGTFDLQLMPELVSLTEGGKDHTWIGGKMTWYIPHKKIADYLAFLENQNGKDLAELMGFERAINTRQPATQQNKGSLRYSEFGVLIERQAKGFWGISPAPVHYRMRYEMHEIPNPVHPTVILIGYFDGRLAGDEVTQFAASAEILQETSDGGLICASLNLYQGQRYKIAFIDLTSKVFDEQKYVDVTDRFLSLLSSSSLENYPPLF